MEMKEDKCRWCKRHIGFGVEWLHIKLCDERECRAKQAGMIRQMRNRMRRSALTTVVKVLPRAKVIKSSKDLKQQVKANFGKPPKEQK